MPYHRWIGTLSIIVILLHGISTLYIYNFNFVGMKMVTGLLAGLNLLLLVLSGWYSLLIRHDFTTRKLHFRLGLSMFILVAMHLIF